MHDVIKNKIEFYKTYIPSLELKKLPEDPRILVSYETDLIFSYMYRRGRACSTLDHVDKAFELSKELTIDKILNPNRLIAITVSLFGIKGNVKDFVRTGDNSLFFVLYDDTGEVLVLKDTDFDSEIDITNKSRIFGSLINVHNKPMIKLNRLQPLEKIR